MDPQYLQSVPIYTQIDFLNTHSLLSFKQMYSHVATTIVKIWNISIAHSGNELACRRHKRQRPDSWVGKIPWRRAWHRLQCSWLENPVDRGAWWATVREVSGSDWAHSLGFLVPFRSQPVPLMPEPPPIWALFLQFCPFSNVYKWNHASCTLSSFFRPLSLAEGSTLLSHVPGFCSFLFLSGTASDGCVRVHLSTHQLKPRWHFQYSRYCKLMMNVYFQLSWVNTQACNCWAVW